MLLIAVAVGVALWNYVGAGGDAPRPAAAPSQTRPTATAAEPLPPAEGVRLNSLEQAREAPSDTTRNPFRFGQRASASPPPSQDAAPVFTPAPAEPAAPTGPAPPPPIPLKFIGMVEKEDGVKWAVLSLGDGRPLHGREGDIIDGRYRILKIGIESVEMVYLDGRGRQTIRLTGQ